jgi:hypothetical protein
MSYEIKLLYKLRDTIYKIVPGLADDSTVGAMGLARRRGKMRFFESI